ncbi:MAG TPA: VIT domain-containing protein [Polyangiaceae bacterium]|nr:VIT domain-containing protein [Polyangiaceae bacterium]
MKHSLRPFAIVIVLLLALLARRAGAESPDSADHNLSPYFFVEGADPAVDRLPLQATRVEVAVSGVIADVTVRQIYQNQGPKPLHARYVFPASTRAAVYGMTMTVGNQRVVAKIEERERAKRDFDRAKEEGKSASLLEQDRPNVFSMNVANIMPRDTIAVELKYTELLMPTDGTYELVYPTVVGPRYAAKDSAAAAPRDRFVEVPYLHEGESPKSEFHLTATLSTGVPLDDVGCATHQVVTRRDGASRAEVALAPAELFSGNRDFVLRYRLAGSQVSTGLILYQGRDENFFLMMAQPPRSVAADDVPPREYVFVLDVSGSMNGFPLDTAKKLMRDLVHVVRPTDTFNIVLFADGSRTLWPASRPASTENLERALRFIGPQPGGGGTELLAALKRAVALPRPSPNVARTVVLLTDGYIDAEKETFGYIRDHLDQANFFSFGMGSSVNRFLVEGVAHAGQGEPFVVTRAEDSAKAAAKFRRYIQSPVLTGVRVAFNGFETYDVEPIKVPDLFAERPIVVFGKWRGQPRGTIDISGSSGRDVYRTSVQVADAVPDERHRALSHLWARARLTNLFDFERGEDADSVAEIKSIGLTYSLLTPYTSFIAVHEVVRNAGGHAEDVDQPLPLPLGVSDLAVGASAVTTGAEPELAWMGAVLLVALAGRSLLEMRKRRAPGLAA